MLRRTFVAGMAGAPVSMMQAAAPPVKIGIDLFSVRSSPWNAFEFLDYAGRLGARVVHFSEIRFLGSLEDDHIRKVRSHAEKLGIEI